MEDSTLFYERGVMTESDIKKLFEYVKSNSNIMLYRGYLRSERKTDYNTHSYAWDETKGAYVYKKGIEWFPNPNYNPADLAFTFDEVFNGEENKTTI